MVHAMKASERVPAHVQIERAIVRGLLRHMAGLGWRVQSVDDGDGWREAVSVDANRDGQPWTESEVMHMVFAVDEARLMFSHDSEGDAGETMMLRGVRIVLGNGEECISDYSAHRGFYDAVKAFVDGPMFHVEPHLSRTAGDPL